MTERHCLVCGKSLLIKTSHIKKGWGKYCSKKCQAKAQLKGKSVECGYCGKEIYRRPIDFKRSQSKKFFCSPACHCAWENKTKRFGENSPNWITGRTVYRTLLKRYGKPERCSLCGIEDIRVLVVHHVDSNRRNNKPQNLMWLCMNCHCLVHIK